VSRSIYWHAECQNAACHCAEWRYADVIKPGAFLFSKIADVGNNDVVCNTIACVNATFNSLFIERKQKLLNICSNKLATYWFHCK